MKTCYQCKQSKLISDFYKDKSRFDGLQSKCKSCLNEYNATWSKKNLSYRTEYKRQYVKDNKDHIKYINKLYQEKNKEKLLEQNKKYYAKHPEKRKQYYRKYAKKNTAKIAALKNKRYCSKMNRTPKWLTLQDLYQIETFYKEAQRLTKETGIQYHVDHIVPLQGKEVSGLHVPWNLQVILATENLKKRNKYGN